jgi:hypothetical protein
VLTPDTPAVRRLAGLLAAALACPDEPYKRICSADTVTSFGCLFGAAETPQQCAVRGMGWGNGNRQGLGTRRLSREVLAHACCCVAPFPGPGGPAPGPTAPALPRHSLPPTPNEQDRSVCVSDPACRAPVLSGHVAFAESEAAALAGLGEAPADAVVVFGGGGGGGSGGGGGGGSGRGSGAGGGDGGGSGGSDGARGRQGEQQRQREPLLDGLPLSDLLSYEIRMNRSDVPPPGLLRDLFDVAPGDMPLPGNLLWCGLGCALGVERL